MSIASNIATIFQRKKALRAEVIRPFREQYIDDILRPLARGEEIDEQRVFEVTDALSIDEARLSKDVRTQQDRFDLAAQLAQRHQAEIDLLEATAEAERLDAEHQAFMDKWKPKRTAAFEKMRAAELVALQTMHVEAKLIETCLDTELIEQTKELEAKRHKVGMALRKIQDDVKAAQGRISYAKAIVEQTKLDNDRMPRAFLEGHQATRDKLKGHNLKQAKEKLAAEERAAAPVFAQFDKLKLESAKLETELRELNRLKLVP